MPHLGVIENIVLGNEPTRGPFLDDAAAAAVASKVLADLGVVLPFDRPVRRFSVAQQQTVEIAKALARNARLIVMDEPTAALTDREINALFTLIRGLRERGVAFVYISHRLEELPKIADRITVLRDGRAIETHPAAEIPRDELIHLMVGPTARRALPRSSRGRGRCAGRSARRASSASAAHVEDVSFEVRGGEIVGLAGLVGAGRTEIVRAIAGADVPTAGQIDIDDRRVVVHNPRSAIRAGIALIPEDRKAQGLVLGMNVRENTTLAHLDTYSPRGSSMTRAERAVAHREIADLPSARRAKSRSCATSPVEPSRRSFSRSG